MEENGGGIRFFSKGEDEKSIEQSKSAAAIELSEEVERADKCLTLRYLQKFFSWCVNQNSWEPSRTNVFSSHDGGETQYPTVLTFLESVYLQIIFVTSCFMSVVILLFAQGFVLKSRILWAVLHAVNSVYVTGIFCEWVVILIKSKYSKTNQGFTKVDVIFTILVIFPTDLIVLAVFSINEKEIITKTDEWIAFLSRINYFFRIRHIFLYFNKWEENLIVGDFAMFIIRTLTYVAFLIHLFACFWHRCACESFSSKHFLMSPEEATVDVCSNKSWIVRLQKTEHSPLLYHPGWNVLTIHYLVSVYWVFLTAFRLGTGEIRTTLSSDFEVSFTIITEIISWIFLLTAVTGNLTSLLIESNTEKQNFLTRRFAIKHYLDFTEVSQKTKKDVERFYDYLWDRSRGVTEIKLIEELPRSMKIDIFYAVNRFVLEQVPLLSLCDKSFLMDLAVRMEQTYFLSRDILFRKHEPGDSMYYLLKGELEILNDAETHAITALRSGTIIGEIHLMHPHLHTATVRCATECDLLVLTKQSVKAVLEKFPDYIPLLQARIQSIFEQSSLLLALCERHNQYRKLFDRIDANFQVTPKARASATNEFANLNYLMDNPNELQHLRKGSVMNTLDYDGLNVITSKHNLRPQKVNASADSGGISSNKDLSNLLREAYFALEADVQRAGALAKDLNIPRPPANVFAPRFFQAKPIRVNQGFQSSVLKIFPQITSQDLMWRVHIYKVILYFYLLLSTWIILYNFAFFRSYLALHIIVLFDLIFVLDLIFDSVQVVVTPQKTLEELKDIFFYRLRHGEIYIRGIAIFPIANILGVALHWKSGQEGEYYLLALNRVLLWPYIYKNIAHMESIIDFPVVYFIVKYIFTFAYLTHIFAVFFEYSIRRYLKDRPEGSTVQNTFASPEFFNPDRTYEFCYYWALQLVSTTGFGDINNITNTQVLLTLVSLTFGTLMVITITGVISGLLANYERRRLCFHKEYYSAERLMRWRRFPKSLKNRVLNYYELQWRQHEGVPILSTASCIADAPHHIVTKVSRDKALDYVSRVPLFKDLPEIAQMAMCKAINQYYIPPGEVVMYPNDRSRALFIIAQGFCQVKYNNELIGTISEGRYFGLPGLLYGTNKPYEVETVTHCKFFCLEFENFVDAARKFPYFMEQYKILRGEILVENDKDTLSDYEIPCSESIMKELFDRHGITFEENRSSGESLVAVTKPGKDVASSVQPSRWYRKDLFNFSRLPSTIDPNGQIFKAWVIFRILTATIVAVFVPCQAAFPINRGLTWTVLLILDAVAIADIFVTMFTGFYGEHNQLITQKQKTAMHYLKGIFFLDLIACFPIDLIVLIFSAVIPFFSDQNSTEYALAMVRFNRVIQGYRLFMAGKRLQKVVFKSLSFITLIEVIPYFALLLNTFACIAVMCVCTPDFLDGRLNCSEQAWIESGNLFEYEETDKVLSSPLRTYVISIYWITSAMLCVGFGDVETVNPQNRGLVIAIILIGVIASAYISAKLAACMASEHARRIAVREKITVLLQFLEQFKAPKSIIRRVTERFYHEWNCTQGISAKALFNPLHPILKSDVMKELYEESLIKSPIFQRLDSPGLRMLSSHLTEVFLPEGEFVMKCGDLNDDVFFISRGIVVLYNMQGAISSYLGAGSLFGEISALFEVQRLHSAVAATDIELYVFSKDNFLDFLSMYPELRSVLERSSLSHYKQTVEEAAKHLGYDLALPISEQGNFIGNTIRTSALNAALRMYAAKSLKMHQDEEPNSPSSISSRQFPSDLNSSIILSEQECVQRHAEFISDPMRVPLGEEETLKEKEPILSLNDSWYSWIVTFGRVPRDEMGLVHVVQEKNKCNIFNFVVHPSSIVCSWLSFCLFVTAFSCGLTAYEIAFTSRNYHISKYAFIMRVFLEVFFVIRILGNFHLAFKDEKGALVINARSITRRYIVRPNGLFMDILSTFPLYAFAELMESGYSVSKNLRALQLFRVVLFMDYLNETETDLRVIAYRVKLLKVTILICFIFHFCACAWYLVACYGKTCSPGSWMSILINQFMDKDEIENGTELKLGSRYLLSLSFVSNSLTFTGLGGITPRTMIEIITTIMIIFTTIFIFGYLLGEMAQILASQVSSKMHYQHILKVTENHLSSIGLSSSKLSVIRDYFRLLWKKSKGSSYQAVMSDLPYSLKADICYSVYGTNIRSTRIFGRLDDNVIRQLCAKMMHEMFLPGTHILRSGDICDAMYFIKKGEIVIMDDSTHVGLCVETLYENECFGEVKVLLQNERYRFSYVARLESEVGVLLKTDIEEVVDKFPKMREELCDKARRIKEHRLALKEEEERIYSASQAGTPASGTGLSLDEKDRL